MARQCVVDRQNGGVFVRLPFSLATAPGPKASVAESYSRGMSLKRAALRGLARSTEWTAKVVSTIGDRSAAEKFRSAPDVSRS